MGRTRRKRRSSLSDLRPPTSSSDASSISPTQQLRPTTPSSHPRGEVVTPTKQSRPQSSYIPTSPIRRLSPPRPSTPSRKENIDPRTPQAERTTKSKGGVSESPVEESRRRSHTSGIPQRTPGLRERPTVNGSDTKRPQSSSSLQRPHKPRMQSPQKVGHLLFVSFMTSLTLPLVT